jgi:sigma-B regulation protein RsbU (phosphoserine phosphatase)
LPPDTSTRKKRKWFPLSFAGGLEAQFWYILKREGVDLDDQLLAPLRGQIVDTMVGSVFLCAGLAACCIAGMRRRGGMRIFVWLGIWGAMYGAMQLSQLEVVVGVLPRHLQIGAPYANTAMMYLLVVAGSLAFLELSLGKLRTFLQAAAAAGLLIAVAGVGFFAATGSKDKLLPANTLLAACVLVTLTVLVAAPALSRKYLVLPDRGVLATGIFIFGVEALLNSLSRAMGFVMPHFLDHVGFAVLLSSFAYVALRLVLANERRLLGLEHELAVAREIQTSILPRSVPELRHARISVAYCPMSAVAGDFYEFIEVDSNRVGFLIADVCGHGVPAALIASMVKVAVHTVADWANDPGALLSGLNRVLGSQLQGHLVSAAYLWLDMESHTATYAGAGHPPLLRWRQGRLEQIESNGLIFGVTPKAGVYPVRSMPIIPGDRLILYTDGLVEPENANGDSFGDSQLENVLRMNQSCPPSELSDRLLSEIQRWQPASMPQQDDITLILIEAV